ncbi:Nitrilotriacetate monooxygenase component A [Marinibacterium anthonyi]|nr:Nitrilotriacetate monooxygenase component A [Marinibacterium anthonyi]
MADKQMALAVLVDGPGNHPAAWLHEDTVPGQVLDVRHMASLAQKAEAAKYDLFFIADTPASRTDNLEVWSRYPMFTNGFEPMTILSALASVTSRIGLGATVSTSFFEPFNIARQFASLDHISGGRAGWNVVTSANDYAARNFGLDRLPPHGDRYAKARECLDVVLQYWDTWEEGAFIYDHGTQMQFDPGKYHAVHHDGPYFKVDGGLNIDRTPQGHPVIIQAGASEAGRAFAAETAEVVFATGSRDQLRGFYADLKGRMAGFGRSRDDLKVLAGLCVCVAETKAAAEAKLTELRKLTHPSVGLATISFHLEYDFHKIPLDEPIPVDDLPKEANLHKAFFDNLMGIVKANPGITPRQLYETYDRGTPTLCGSPEEIADVMQDLVEAEACDGFMMLFNTLPGTFDDFNAMVVPELRRRGIFREDYTGTTLRDHLGLKVPANRYGEDAAAFATTA